jgi:HAMP domain-containing protein
MSWTGWTISGAAIALAVLLAAGLAVAIVRGLWLKRRIAWSGRRISPIADGISAGLADIERGVARAQDGAAELGREIDRLRVPVAELQVISRHAWTAIMEIKGPLGWLAGIRALIRYRGR